jgi:hypothetical protein
VTRPQQEESTVIIGLVHPSHLGFKFYTWRDAAGLLHKKKLEFRGKATYGDLQSQRNRLKPYSIIRARVILKDETSAEFLELLDDQVDDHDLEQIAAELKKPLTYEHERLGMFIFDRDRDHWEAAVNWAGQSIRLHIDGDEISNPEEEYLQTAIALWDNQALWNQRILGYAIQKLLKLKNEVWSDEDEMPLSTAEFISRITLELINVEEDGYFEFWYDCGNMFYGHVILILWDLENGPTRATIAG